MNIFANLMKAGGKDNAGSDEAARPMGRHQLDQEQDVDGTRVRKRTGRTDVYAVRVRKSFKGEILGLQAELQLARQTMKGKARKVTEGEVVELMLDAFQVAQRNRQTDDNAVPLANDVWQGVHEIARARQPTPSQVIEQLVVREVAEYSLVPHRRVPGS